MKKKISGVLAIIMSISLCFGCGNDSDKKEKTSESIVGSNLEDAIYESLDESTRESVVESTSDTISDNTSEQETTFVDDTEISKEVVENENTTKKQEKTTVKKEDNTAKKQEKTTVKKEATTAKKQVTVCNHSYIDATCKSPAKCSKCGEITGEIGQHNLMGDKCTVCNQKVYVEKWDISEKTDGSVWAYLYNTKNENEYYLVIEGNGKTKDYDVNGSRPWHYSSYDSRKISSAIVNDGITYLGSSTFSDLNICSVSLPETLKEIGDFCFWLCEDLTEIKLPSSLNIIGECGLAGNGLKVVDIPNGVTKIGKQALSSNKLEKIYIPRNVSIGIVAFHSVNENTEIYYAGTKEEWEKTGSIGDYFYSDHIVHCSDGDYNTPGCYYH